MTVPVSEAGPTARALLALELIQARPGITADQLARRLGVSGRAARRYVAILREAGIAIESTTGRYGGYRAGRGVRIPPLMFTATEALALVMAVLEGHGPVPAESDDPVGDAVAKISRVLPEAVAASVEAVRTVSSRRPAVDGAPDPETTAALVRASRAGHRVRLRYRLDADRERVLDVDPWAVVVRHSYWYLLCWSHHARSRRTLRVDRVVSVEQLTETFSAPADLDPARELEEQLAMGWRWEVRVLIDAPLALVARCVRPNLGRLSAVADEQTLLSGSTENPRWYAEQLAPVPAPFRVLAPPELAEAVCSLGRRLVEAGQPGSAPSPAPARAEG